MRNDNDYNKIAAIYEKMYAGKEFIYMSKYGSKTPGIVEHVQIVHKYLGVKYSQLEIYILSTKGNLYRLEEVYINNGDLIDDG